MRWKIKGADRVTADERELVFDAEDERAALLKAKKMSLLVESLEPVGELSPTIDYATPNASTPPPHLPPLPPRPAKLKPDLTIHEQIGTVALNVIAAFFHLAGFLMLIGAWMNSSHTLSRFQVDNAIGASANALETLYRHASAQTGIALIIAALLAQNVSNQIVTRGLIRAQGASR